jgi:hypothetical protein
MLISLLSDDIVVEPYDQVSLAVSYRVTVEFNNLIRLDHVE